MTVEISLPAALPEEDKAEVNNVIPLSLLLPSNHQSHPLINVVCSHKRCDVFVLNEMVPLSFIKFRLRTRSGARRASVLSRVLMSCSYISPWITFLETGVGVGVEGCWVSKGLVFV